MNNTIVEIEKLDWNKMNGLIPAVIQNYRTLQILMVGFMNKEALKQTYSLKKVTFYSRTKKRLWTKGETSGHQLILKQIISDCDKDALLIMVQSDQACCHLNSTSCFGSEDGPGLGILAKLEQLLDQRYQERPKNSYVTNLFDKGTQRIAQKVGEEGLEVSLASMSGSKEDIISESADLLFHLLVLLRQNRIEFSEVLNVLGKRREEGKRINANGLSTKSLLPEQLKKGLTKREIQCLNYYVQGFSAKVIANLLHLSTRTVENHICNIKMKLGISSKSDLIFKARLDR